MVDTQLNLTQEKGKLIEGSIVSKAYEINLDKLDEGYLSNNIICHADNYNKAKSVLLKQVQYDGWKLKYINTELTYLNIPVKRRKSADKVVFEGNIVYRHFIDKIKRERERMLELDAILNNKNITHCYIKKNGLFYAPNNSGYVSIKENAGIYDKQDAVNSAKRCDELYLLPIDIDAHNKMIKEKIAELETRLINN